MIITKLSREIEGWGVGLFENKILLGIFKFSKKTNRNTFGPK